MASRAPRAYYAVARALARGGRRRPLSRSGWSRRSIWGWLRWSSHANDLSFQKHDPRETVMILRKALYIFITVCMWHKLPFKLVIRNDLTKLSALQKRLLKN